MQLNEFTGLTLWYWRLLLRLATAYFAFSLTQIAVAGPNQSEMNARSIAHSKSRLGIPRCLAKSPSVLQGQAAPRREGEEVLAADESDPCERLEQETEQEIKSCLDCSFKLETTLFYPQSRFMELLQQSKRKLTPSIAHLCLHHFPIPPPQTIA